jgi:hypothetical protein
MEAADLGVRLCQTAAASVYPCFFAVVLPVIAVALASYEIAAWLPGVVLWLAKPWLDRTILFVLSRAAFGLRTSLDDLWRSQRSVVWGQLLLTWTVRRLSPWRSFTQPVYQLEGLSAWNARRRVLQIRRGRAGPALLMTSAFGLAETSLVTALASLAIWFAPVQQAPSWGEILAGEMSVFFALLLPLCYAAVVAFLEPFYVAAGFAMYLNRRADLEAWDIEQDFRRAFAT